MRWTPGHTAVAVALVGLGTVLGAAIGGWPGTPVDCLAAPCFCERPGLGLMRQPVNTWSNLGPVLLGLWLASVLARRPELPAFLRHAFPAALVFQGVGSMYFHGGLVRWGATLDALSMFISMGLLVASALLRLGWLQPKTVGWFWGVDALVGLALGAWNGDAVTGLLTVHFLFLLASEVLLSRRGRAPHQALFRAGLLTHLVGLTVWFESMFDGQPLCRPESAWQGHGLWHLTAATAVALFAVHVAQNFGVASLRAPRR